MTDDTLDLLIRQLNAGELKDKAFIRPLTQDVWEGSVWVDVPTVPVFHEQGYHVFFIKGENGEFVAVVLDMGSSDLHAYVAPEHRKKGFLANALSSTFAHLWA